jgi:glycosyltransferase involved in cell wall biosynthesis
MHRDVQRSSRKDDILVTEPVYDEHLKAALSAADLFVLPSLNENFGNAAAEAVAANLPVLLTETCGIAPIIDGRAGMAVGLEVESLAEGIRQMMKSEVRSQMTARSEEVKRELSWEEPIRQQIEIYREAIARNTEKLKR